MTWGRLIGRTAPFGRLSLPARGTETLAVKVYCKFYCIYFLISNHRSGNKKKGGSVVSVFNGNILRGGGGVTF